MAVVSLVKIESWPTITLEVPEGFHTLLWFVLIMSILVLFFCTLISAAIVIYTTYYLIRNKCYGISWYDVKTKLNSFLKRNEDQSDSAILSSDILYEANREIERMENIDLP